MLTLRLVPYSATYVLPKDFIRTALTGSILDQALQEEPDLPELDINTLDVTPEAMQMLVDYSQGREPNHHIPELISAERYLNIPWLLYYVDPLYDRIPNRQTITALENTPILSEAIRGDHDLIVGYFIAKGWQPTKEDFDNAILYSPHAWHVASILLRSKSRLSPEDKDPLLIAAVEYDKLDIVKMLMSDPEVNPATDNNYPIIAAASNNNPDMMQLLLQDPRVDPEAAARSERNRGYDEPTWRVLVNDPKSSVNVKNAALWWSAWHGYPNLVHDLLMVPNISIDFDLLNAAYTGRKCLLESGQYTPEKIVEYDTIIAELRADPRMRKLLSEQEYVFDPNMYTCD
jgi:hypothetical protein